MNVEFQCREKVGNEEDYEDQESRPLCGKRYSTIPGNPYGLHCNLHPEGVLKQTEFYGGADFLNVEEDGTTRSKGHVATQDARNQPPQNFTEPPPPTTVTPEAERLAGLRTAYADLTEELGERKEANLRWGTGRLSAEVDILRGKATIARTEAEEKAKELEVGGPIVPAPNTNFGPVLPPAVLAPGETHAEDTGPKL